MKTINLRYCYPYYTGDVFVEVSDEVAEVMVQSVREMYNYDRRTRYHKAFYSLGCVCQQSVGGYWQAGTD